MWTRTGILPTLRPAAAESRDPARGYRDSTPKKEDIAAEPLKGRVEYFNTEKGYGFIKDLASTEKYFFHISSAPEGIGEGRIVLFELMRGTRGMNAVKIAFAQ
mgnify:CR=1 FL=1